VSCLQLSRVLSPYGLVDITMQGTRHAIVAVRAHKMWVASFCVCWMLVLMVAAFIYYCYHVATHRPTGLCFPAILHSASFDCVSPSFLAILLVYAALGETWHYSKNTFKNCSVYLLVLWLFHGQVFDNYVGVVSAVYSVVTEFWPVMLVLCNSSWDKQIWM